jgi:hypothetical protein
MITIYWSYKGYCGDRFYGDIDANTGAEYAPNSRSVGFKCFSWLTQKGFGPGYFNNSGVYHAFRKSVFKTEEAKADALALMQQDFHAYTITVFKDDVEYYDSLKEVKVAEKRLRKQNPY